MYNGNGLMTPRGTNGHVQRNWAFVRPGKIDNPKYMSEDDIQKFNSFINRPPNQEILDHDRKRKIEVKCVEFEEILEKQGYTPEEIGFKINLYRMKLTGKSKSDRTKDEFGRIVVRETHQIAEAQQEKNAKLREAFGISEYFIEDRKAKEDLAKSSALKKQASSVDFTASFPGSGKEATSSSKKKSDVLEPPKHRNPFRSRSRDRN